MAAVLMMMSRPPNAAMDSRERVIDGSAVADVDRYGYGGFFAAESLGFGGYCFCGFQIFVGDDDVGAALAARRTASRPMPLPPPTTRQIWRLSSFSGG